MTRVSRARPDVPNGKPLGRHTLTARERKHVVAQTAAAPVALAGTVAHATRNRHERVAVNAVTVMAVTVAIVGTMALPSYGVQPAQLPGAHRPATTVPVVQPQSFVVSAAAEPPAATRDEISATTMEELEAERAKEKAEALAYAQAKQDAIDAAAAGKSVEQVAVAAVPEAPMAEVPEDAPAAEGGSVVAVARQYLGVPYVFGGASPAGFDCSGLVLYVYAQFGIALPHSSLRQGANGTRVHDPRPGDLIVIDGGNHIGIYSGDGYMIDAPMPGRVVNERPIYTSNHFFVRY